jgi:cyclic pyranopterin phosphate synthase
MPAEGVPLCGRDEILSYEEIAALVACLRDEFGLSKVRVTGGEPLVRPNVERLIGMLSDLGVTDIALTTNGVRLAEMAAALKGAGLHRVNVSLDSLSPDTFRRLTRGGDLRATLSGIAAAVTHGLRPLKLNTVVIRGVNDAELPDLVAFAFREHCEIRFIELMPIGPGAGLYPDGFMSSTAVREALSGYFALEPALPEYGSSARRYGVTDASGRRGTVGFISSCSEPFCAECARLRVTADGRLIGCLARNGGISVREMLRAGDTEAVCDAARAVLGAKRVDRLFAQGMAMASIGG